jgi:eukaryotic-like serine/threonine-protein kinase
VLEYVAGESLNRILAREKKLPLPTALRLVEEVAEALDYAHAQGVIHRDIKPGNILINEDGHAKIADFGIAKLNLAHFTLPGKVLGTPAYMSPEQLSGEGVDGRSDLFSLGVILYTMVAGHSPFQGDSATTVCFKVANREPVAASALDLTLPRELDDVISRAMAKNPEERYQRGAELAEDVRQLQRPFQPSSTTTSLRAIGPLATASTGTRPRTSRQAVAATNHAAEVVKADKAIRNAIRKAPVRDLILGVATLIALVFVAAQTKLQVTSPKEGANAYVTPAGTAAPGFNPTSSKDAPSTATSAVPATPAHSGVSKKGRSSIGHTASPIVVPLSNLDLTVQHQFKDATLFVWVDDKLMLTKPLHGAAQKHLVVFNGLHGAESETLKIPAGKHLIRVRALSADETIDLSRTASGEFIGGADKALHVTIDKHNTMMKLNWGQ